MNMNNRLLKSVLIAFFKVLIRKIPVMKPEENKEKKENQHSLPNPPQNQNSKKSGETLEESFADSLKEMLWVENAVAGGLKKMAKASSNEDLKTAFEDHEQDTQRHIHRLKRVFEWIDQSPETKKCMIMEAMLKEADQIVERSPEGSTTRDALLLLMAQKIEHYEIACYGGLVQMALTLDLPKVADKLYKNLQEEEDAEQLLTEIAETNIRFEMATEESNSSETP
jgi:ferritin-like metal-binding protein YciE